MTGWTRIIGLTLVLGSGMNSTFGEEPVPVVESLASLVFQYIDAHDSDEAGQLLQRILHDKRASVEQSLRS